MKKRSPVTARPGPSIETQLQETLKQVSLRAARINQSPEPITAQQRRTRTLALLATAEFMTKCLVLNRKKTDQRYTP